MSATITIAPAEGRRVRHPDTGVALEGATVVVRSPFWRRRLDDGDVVLAKIKKDPA